MQAMKNPEESSLKLTGLFFSKPPVLANVVSQISSVQQVHHQIEVFSVLERVVHVHQEGILDLREDLTLIHH